jgi:glycosyltransferase involved in cell wall biosynthesis
MDLGALVAGRATGGIRMASSGTRVSIGLPVRNAGDAIVGVVRSVLAQDHENLELFITDNASTDNTEEVCRELARSDSRIVYRRQPQNIGLLNNFRFALANASGTYFRWIGDDDRLEPQFASRCLATFEADPRLLLVTTGISYTGDDGRSQTAAYDGTGFRSDDPVERLDEMLQLLNQSHLLIDPLYAMMRREPVNAIPRRNMLREDEVFSTKLALAGPWGHVPEVLAHRHWKAEKIGAIGQRLGVPQWQSRFSNTLAYREILSWLSQADLTPDQRRRARAAVYARFTTRQWRIVQRRSRKLARIATFR